MNNLHRELAPISDAAWADLEAEVRRTFTRRLAGLAEFGGRPLLELAVDRCVDSFVEEGDQPGDLLAFLQGGAVGPGEVWHEPVAYAGRPVLRVALVRAVGDGGGGHQ